MCIYFKLNLLRFKATITEPFRRINFSNQYSKLDIIILLYLLTKLSVVQGYSKWNTKWISNSLCINNFLIIALFQVLDYLMNLKWILVITLNVTETHFTDHERFVLAFIWVQFKWEREDYVTLISNNNWVSKLTIWIPRDH